MKGELYSLLEEYFGGKGYDEKKLNVLRDGMKYYVEELEDMKMKRKDCDNYRELFYSLNKQFNELIEFGVRYIGSDDWCDRVGHLDWDSANMKIDLFKLKKRKEVLKHNIKSDLPEWLYIIFISCYILRFIEDAISIFRPDLCVSE